MNKLRGEELRQAWDKLTATKTKEQIAVMITKTDAYWDYLKKYDPAYPEIPFSDVSEVELNSLETPNSLEEDVYYLETKDKIFAQLTPIQQQIVEMREQGFSYNDISRVIGKRAGAIRQIMRRVRNKLKKHLYNNF